MKRNWLWLLYLLPAALGAVAALILSLQGVPNPRLTLGVAGDAAGLALAAGLVLSALLVLVGLLVARPERRYRRQLAANSRATAEEHRHFLRRLDHEIKAPLAAARNDLTHLGLHAKEWPAEAQEILASAGTHLQQLSALLEDLRRLANLETGPLERRKVDMGGLLGEVVEMARQGSGDLPGVGHGRNLTLTLQESPWPLPNVFGDHDLLLRAVYNVVDNACKFSPPGTPVEIWALREGSGLRIQVTDEGQGVAQEDLPHLGQELYRGRTARNVPGTGLGLAMARAIARRHGGDLTVDSVLGQGTVITIHLPAAGGA